MYHVELIDFPVSTCRELVTLNEDGSYTIFINSKLSLESQREACAHALRHIENDDFNTSVSASEAEIRAHNE